MNLAARLKLMRARVLLLALGTASLMYGSATLSGPDQNASPGDSLSLSLSLSAGGQNVSGIQFDLVWDPTFDIQLVPGTQAGIANKVLYSTLLQPRMLRCVIVGLNNSTLTDGELLQLYIAVDANAAAGASQLNLVNVTATGADGTPIFLQASTIGVQIQSGGISQSIRPSGVLNAASLATGPICPGEVVTLTGSIPDGTPAVMVNGIPATVTYAGLNQVNFIVPFELDLSNPAQLELRENGSSATISVPVTAAAPGIFTLGANGIGPGAILNQDYSVNSPSAPAARGSVIMIYAAGFGALAPLPVDGQIAQALANTTSEVTATIDGIAAPVLYAGAAPSLINGMVQINVLVPDGAHTNPAAPVSLSMGSVTTQPGVTVSIQ